MRPYPRSKEFLLFAVVVVGSVQAVRAFPATPPDYTNSPTDPTRVGVDRLLAEYIGLCPVPTIDRRQKLFQPAVVVAFPDDYGSITTHTLNEFVARQNI